MRTIPDAVHALERELRGVFGARLQSLVLYGMNAADASHGNGHAHGAAPHPVRTMAVVEGLSQQDLRACAGRVAAWHDLGLATPLFLHAQEFDRSLDVFPLEFGAILADHAVVAGRNPFEASTVDPADVRRACEVQARGHLLHLREGYVEAGGNGHAIAVLVVESAAPFAALLTSVARLEKRVDGDAAAAGRHIERTLGLAAGSLTDIVALAGVREIPAADAERIFPSYLEAVERLVSYVDGWSAR